MRYLATALLALAMSLSLPGAAPAQSFSDYMEAAAVSVVAEEKLDAPPGSYTFDVDNFAIRGVEGDELGIYYYTLDVEGCRYAAALAIYAIVRQRSHGEFRVDLQCGNRMQIDGLIDLNSYPPRYAVSQYQDGDRIYSTSWRGSY